MNFRAAWVQNQQGQSFGPADKATILQWIREGRVDGSCTLVNADTRETYSVAAIPELAQAIPVTALNVLIPRNGLALVSYYVGLFSFLGLLLFALPGPIMGIIAIITGVMGWRRANANPAMRGKAHAITGIICGSITLLLGTILTIAAILIILEGP